MAQIGNFQNFTWDQLEAAKNSRKALIKKIQQLPTDNIRNIQFDEKVFEILADNLNTPKLLAEIHEALNHNENIYANLVVKYFMCEKTTKDGYILRLERIPPFNQTDLK